jgi:hypothetical protein
MLRLPTGGGGKGKENDEKSYISEGYTLSPLW